MVNASINYQQPENIETISGFFLNYLNGQTDGGWIAAIMIISFGVPFMALLEFNAKAAFGAASFNMLMTTIMLSAFGLSGIGFYYVIAAVGVAAALIINNNGGVR